MTPITARYAVFCEPEAADALRSAADWIEDTYPEHNPLLISFQWDEDHNSKTGGIWTVMVVQDA